MSGTKPLPVAPSIEFERKAAKALLRALHASDPIALSRVSAHSSAISMTSPQPLQLSDAQLVIAREYALRVGRAWCTTLTDSIDCEIVHRRQ